MKNFKITFKSRKEGEQQSVINTPIFNEIFKNSFVIARAFGEIDVKEEHLLLALLKYAPESLAVKYMEQYQSKQSWKLLWHERLIKNNVNRRAKYAFFQHSRMFQLLKNVPLEKQLLQCKENDENCILLSLLRYQDFDGLTYKDAIQFIKKHSPPLQIF